MEDRPPDGWRDLGELAAEAGIERRSMLKRLRSLNLPPEEARKVRVRGARPTWHVSPSGAALLLAYPERPDEGQSVPSRRDHAPSGDSDRLVTAEMALAEERRGRLLDEVASVRQQRRDAEEIRALRLKLVEESDRRIAELDAQEDRLVRRIADMGLADLDG